MPTRRPRTRGLKRAFELEREKEAQLANQLTLNEQFGIMMNENREYWLERANTHLEELLAKANRDMEIQRRMAKYYAMRNKIARAKLKRAQARIEALVHQEEKDKLDLLVEDSTHA